MTETVYLVRRQSNKRQGKFHLTYNLYIEVVENDIKKERDEQSIFILCNKSYLS